MYCCFLTYTFEVCCGHIQERVGKDGKKTYKVTIRLKGHPTETATFSRKTDIKKWIQSTESAIREGRFFQSAKLRQKTIAELIDCYQEKQLIGTKYERRRKFQLNWWKDRVGKYTLASLKKETLTDARDELVKETSAATATRYMAALSHAFTVAVKEWGWLDKNPMTAISRPKEPPGRVRFLTPVQRKALLDACKASEYRNLYPMIVLAPTLSNIQHRTVGQRSAGRAGQVAA